MFPFDDVIMEGVLPRNHCEQLGRAMEGHKPIAGKFVDWFTSESVFRANWRHNFDDRLLITNMEFIPLLLTGNHNLY